MLPIVDDQIDDHDPSKIIDRTYIAQDEARLRSQAAKMKNKERYDAHHVDVEYRKRWRSRVALLTEKTQRSE